MKTKPLILVSKQLYLMVCFVFFTTFSLFSQSITAPVFNGGPPTLCAYEINTGNYFNTFKFDFSFSGVFNSGNTFVLEMSDASGDFTSPTIQATSIANPSSPSFLNLIVPPNFIGSSNYKFRIKSTNPVVYSSISSAFSIHFLAFKNSYTINNGLSTATICGAFGITLSVDNPTIPPASLTNLKYNWYKIIAGSPVLIPGETGSSLQVTASGNYQSEIDYGACSIGNSYESQPVTVTFNTSGGNYIITSSNGNIVTTGVPTTLSTPLIGGNTYKWFKDGLFLVGETNYNLITDLPGLYELEINNGSCISRTNSIKLALPSTVPHGKNIPNLVSPNGDGENDTWAIPDDFIIGTNTNVTIMDSNGKIVLNTENYNNDWPQEKIDFDSINPVYYYIITPTTSTIKKGTITIVK